MHSVDMLLMNLVAGNLLARVRKCWLIREHRGILEMNFINSHSHLDDFRLD